jgi:hypothetical protein
MTDKDEKKKPKSTLFFDKMLEDPYYQDLLNKLPVEEKEVVLKALREVSQQFENGLLEPIRKINNN